MERIRRSLRGSFLSHRYMPASARPHQWHSDETAVKNNICSFHVKYLGCVQVYESRGMQVCEDALRMLKSHKRRSRRSTLFVSGDGLRVVDAETKDLLVDQTIEKVAYCAPDRSDERGFSYICRDGTTRRWMCHGFVCARDSGERLSHAVGCAFTICLERKQTRERETEEALQVDEKVTTPTRTGSFRPASIVERITDPQECKPAEPVPVRVVTNPFAVERPHAPPAVLQRQGSLRGIGRLAEASPFKRQSSLGVNDLLSTRERRARGASVDTGFGNNACCGTVAPIAEVHPSAEQQEGNVTLLCRELAQGLDPHPEAQQTVADQSTPRPDDWLNSLANGQAMSQRHGRSHSLACDSLISANWAQRPPPAGPVGLWGTTPRVPTGDTTNPFIGGAKVKTTFELQM